MSDVNLAAATRIGESLVREAFWFDGRCNWISSVTRDPGRLPGTTFGTLGSSVYEGSAGVAWFLGHLYRLAGIEDFRRTALGAIRHSLRAANTKPRARPLSLYLGRLGVAVLAIDLAHQLSHDAIRAEAIGLLYHLISHRSRLSERDLLSGTSGAIVAVLIAAAQLRSDCLTEFASALGDRLIRCSWQSRTHERPRWSGPKAAGLSHGASGTAYALFEVFAATGGKRFLRAAERAIAEKDPSFDADMQNWSELSSWCNGIPGVALSRLRAWEITGDERYRDEATHAIQSTRTILAKSLQSVHESCLCHGIAGNASILHEAMHRSKEFRNLESAALMRKAASALRSKNSHSRGVSLFLGSAGIGYFNLRLHDPTLPSILLPRPADFARSLSLTGGCESVAAIGCARRWDRS